MIEAKPENLIEDRAYEDDRLSKEVRQQGIAKIVPNKSSRAKKRTQYGGRVRWHGWRWIVTPSFAWLQCQRRVRSDGNTPWLIFVSSCNLPPLTFDSIDFATGFSKLPRIRVFLGTP